MPLKCIRIDNKLCLNAKFYWVYTLWFLFFSHPHRFIQTFLVFSALAFPYVSPATAVSAHLCHCLKHCPCPRAMCWGLCTRLHAKCDICQDARRAGIWQTCVTERTDAQRGGGARRSGTAVAVSLSGEALEPWLMIAAGWQRCFSFSPAHSPPHVDELGKNVNSCQRPTLQWHIWILSLLMSWEA